ncbi:hypothetical protein OF117_16150 [Geodermatophilus sp. YIM 151500]|uniref:hypothetical protein n=1 Tax=Geodermatophilus sp. YIM 151500 TaxID=2984531 RepID=UPI0021E3B4D6|nr:hypothetical protein [Geodermatophilus sp. YIM 151500]MCV2490888.1 hypothetical protein [Geodermatophilus sp. YIM 151500]
MRHPSDGTLRRLLDEPVAVSDDDRAHVASCATCLTGLAAARADAAAVGGALRPGGAAEVDVDRAWAGLAATLATTAPAPAPARRPARAGRWRAALRRPAVAALGALVVVAGGGVAAANDWLPIFRTEQVAPVEFRPADLVALPDLTAYGDLEVTGSGEPETVPDAATAEERTGLDVPAVAELPTGVVGEPAYQVVGQVTATFTFDAESVAAAGGGELPAELAGSRFRMEAGPGVAAVWSQSSGLPALVVARAVAPTVYSDGVPFETARDLLLSLPGLPADLAEQLRALSADGSTLPLPVPADRVTSEPADVDGLPATALASRDGLLAGVVWVDDGVVTVVAGSIGTDEALAVARELR